MDITPQIPHLIELDTVLYTNDWLRKLNTSKTTYYNYIFNIIIIIIFFGGGLFILYCMYRTQQKKLLQERNSKYYQPHQRYIQEQQYLQRSHLQT